MLMAFSMQTACLQHACRWRAVRVQAACRLHADGVLPACGKPAGPVLPACRKRAGGVLLAFWQRAAIVQSAGSGPDGFLVELAESRRPALGPTLGMLDHRRWFHKGSGVEKLSRPHLAVRVTTIRRPAER
jgi:hypothetical protein